MDSEGLSTEYDRLFEEADKILKKYNPCNFKGDTCIVHCKDGCCRSCNYLGPGGCKIRSLGCKLFLCGLQRYQYVKCSEALTQLRVETQEIFGHAYLCMPKGTFLDQALELR